MHVLVLGPVVFKGWDGLLDHTEPHNRAWDHFGAPMLALLREWWSDQKSPGEQCAYYSVLTLIGACVLQEHHCLCSSDQKSRNIMIPDLDPLQRCIFGLLPTKQSSCQCPLWRSTFLTFHSAPSGQSGARLLVRQLSGDWQTAACM